MAEAVIGRANRVDHRARRVAEAIVVASTSGEADPALVARLSGTPSRTRWPHSTSWCGCASSPTTTRWRSATRCWAPRCSAR
ncbi:hypothetical protein HFP72_03160 [Nocardiopsis sp. ARC36]